MQAGFIDLWQMEHFVPCILLPGILLPMTCLTLGHVLRIQGASSRWAVRCWLAICNRSV